MGFGKNGEEGFRGSNFKLQLQVGEEETRKTDMDSENKRKGFWVANFLNWAEDGSNLAH